jgi:xylulokinase
VGGGSKSSLWLRLIASALEKPVDLPDGAHISGPAGAARLAAVAAGADVATLGRRKAVLRTVPPDPGLSDVLVARYERFRALLPVPG